MVSKVMKGGSFLAVAGVILTMSLVVGGLLAIGSMAASSTQGENGGQGGAASQEALTDIPAETLQMIQSSVDKWAPDIPWHIVAGVLKVETDFGRSTAIGVNSDVNFAGCCSGWGQFNRLNASGGLTPACIPSNYTDGSTWGSSMSVDGNGDGKKCVFDPADAIASTANYLQINLGGSGDPCPQVPAILGVDIDSKYKRALHSYNHECIPYQHDPVSGGGVLDWAVRYGYGLTGDDGDSALQVNVGSCPGQVTLRAGANRPGVEMTPVALAYIRCMSAIIGRMIVISYGSNHKQYSKSGLVSNHWGGHAGDLGMGDNGGSNDGPLGDQMMAACLMLGGMSPNEARDRAKVGGLIDLVNNGIAAECIWKVEGHHDHVHAAFKKVG